MRRVILLLLFSYSFYWAEAQRSLGIGVSAGVNAATQFLGVDNKLNQDREVMPGAQIGVALEIPLGGLFELRTGIDITQVGLKYNVEGVISSENRPVYFSFPLLLQLGGKYLYAGGGIYVARAGAGTYKSTLNLLGIPTTVEGDLTFGETANDNYSPTDFGFQLEAGFRLRFLRLGAQYTQGVRNISPEALSNDFTAKNRVLSLKAGLVFSF